MLPPLGRASGDGADASRVNPIAPYPDLASGHWEAPAVPTEVQAQTPDTPLAPLTAECLNEQIELGRETLAPRLGGTPRSTVRAVRRRAPIKRVVGGHPTIGKVASRYHAERLASLLWPNLDTEKARHSLRNCLLELRKALRSDAVQILWADFADCRLDAPTDVAEFAVLEKSNSQPDMEAAANLYRGEFLDDFGLPRSRSASGWRTSARVGAFGRWRCFASCPRLLATMAITLPRLTRPVA